MKTLSEGAVNNLKKSVRGPVIQPKDSNYDEVRRIWNGMIDRHPALIVQCLEARDVAPAIRFAREQNLEISVRGAGHNIAGNALTEGGLMIDFSKMKKVRVDPQNKRAFVQPGATLNDVDATTQAYGLATPLGINSTTGVAGLTLGGGFGWLTRQYGFTIDNLISAKVVTADGQHLTASNKENKDLFWAIRGGGGNFGIITEFEFALHEVGPEIYGGLLVFPLEQARHVMEQYREFVRSAPLESTTLAILRQAPPLPFLPEDVHGKEVIVLATFYNGDVEKGDDLANYLRKFGKPVGEHLGVQPYVQWQQAFDPLLTPGARNYWKSHNLTRLSDGLITSTLEYAKKMPSPHCEILFGYIAGVFNKIATDAMAFAHRDTQYIMNVHGRWEDPKQDNQCITWSRNLFEASKPFASAGVYVNFMTEDEVDRVISAYGSNYERLVQLKQKYDPDNLFHLNQNIKPKLMAK